MKLASYRHKRDGRLMVVSRDLTRCRAVSDIAPTLQDALDNWHTVCPRLMLVAEALEAGGGEGFDQSLCAAPLPRAYQIADGSAYLNHVELVRRARGAEMPPEFLRDPLMYQAVSDVILAPTDPIAVPDESFGVDFEAEIAVIVDDVPMGVAAEKAAAHIRLVMVMNDVSLRNLIPAELGKGFGFFQSKPPSAFSPVAVTPDELGAGWDRSGRLNLPVTSTLNGRVVGSPNAGVDMQFNFGQLIAHAARTRPLSAGTIIGSGTVSNRDRSAGVSCLAETRMIEKIETGTAATPFMTYGDHIRIEVKEKGGRSIFGAIDQTVVKPC